MRGFWTGRRRFGSGPRPGAPEARVDFVRGLAEHVSESRRNTQSVRFRLAFAGVLSLMLLASLAAFGGVSSAATGFMAHPIKAVKASVMWQAKAMKTKARQNGATYSPADHEYDNECHRRHDDHERGLHRHHNDEDSALAGHQTDRNHPNMTRAQRNAHYANENQALARHQNGENDNENDDERECHRHGDHDHGHHGGGGGDH